MTIINRWDHGNSMAHAFVWMSWGSGFGFVSIVVSTQSEIRFMGDPCKGKIGLATPNNPHSWLLSKSDHEERSVPTVTISRFCFSSHKYMECWREFRDRIGVYSPIMANRPYNLSNSGIGLRRFHKQRTINHILDTKLIDYWLNIFYMPCFPDLRQHNTIRIPRCL